VFEITNVAPIFDIYPSVAEAMAAMALDETHHA
jgi:hypothetical protein